MTKLLTLALMILIATDSSGMSSLFGRKETKKPTTSVSPTPEPVKETLPETVVVPGGTELDAVGTVKTPEEVIKVEEVPGQSKKTGDFAVKSTLPVVIELAKLGNCLVEKQKFLDEIRDHKQFDYTKLKSPEVAKKLGTYTPVVVTTYK